MPTRTRTPPPFGQRLAALRSQRYWTQDMLADQSGLSRGIIQALEQGVRANPCLATVLRLAKALNVTLDELIHLDDLGALAVAADALPEAG
ncbi:MAG: helix-turn-helix transcriptional regulator [Planctomycetia bacterium]|nr:helix-turn-helix transcriptional regulator [Planctomycetia bacterium]